MTLGPRLHIALALTVASLAAEGGLLAAVFLAVLGGQFAVRKPNFRLPAPFLLFAVLTVTATAFSVEPLAEGVRIGFTIVARAGIVLLLVRWATERATAFEFAALFARFRLAWLGFALGVALNALPDLQASARRTWEAMRTRGRGRNPADWRRYAVAVLANALLRADAQAEVAATRGFRLDRMPEERARWSRADLLLVLLAWGFAAAVLVFRSVAW